MEMFFSPTTMAFYDSQLKEYYKQSGKWPSDVIEISEEKYWSLLKGQSAGKIISLDEHGNPILITPPPLSQEEHIVRAEQRKIELMDFASKTIAPLQDAVDLNIATDEEGFMLMEWKKYRIQLNRIELNNAPDIKWPVAPS